MTTQPSTVAAHEAIFQLLNGMFVTGAIACLARLGVPDLLEAGPRSSDDLAKKVGADPKALYRLMRATASIGVLSEGRDGTFSQTPLSDVLRSNANPSLRAWAIMMGQDWHARGWADLEYCVRTGKQSPEHLYGKPAFEWLFGHPDLAENFNQAMTALSMIDAPAVADAYSFEGIRTIVDVAGGHGLMLATILERHPSMKGTLFDLPQVIEGAKKGPLQPLATRCTFETGDMFQALPDGVDAYIMKHIIHDWPDELCVKILKNCRQGVNPGGKLLVVDHVIHPGNEFEPGKLLDLEMLIFPGGQERTDQQFRDLFAAGGWQVSRIIPTAAKLSIVEGIVN